MKETLIQSAISIIGFIVTYICMRKSFKNESIKQKTQIHIERMVDIPYKILDMLNMDNSRVSKVKTATIEDFNEILTTIYTYGSDKAITITSLYQKENHMGALNNNQARMMSFYILMAIQIKYDVTGIAVSPEHWYNMKINDYSTNIEFRNNIQIENNKLVKELKLNKKFKISEDKLID